MEHLFRGISMRIGVEIVEPMRQDSNGIEAVLQCIPVGLNIHTIGKSAHDKGVRAELFQVCCEPTDKVLTVNRATSRAHNADDAPAIEVGGALIE